MSDRPTIQSGHVGNEPSCALIVVESEIVLLRRLVAHYVIELESVGAAPGAVALELEGVLRRAEQIAS
jgi:hypothetical protein